MERCGGVQEKVVVVVAPHKFFWVLRFLFLYFYLTL